MVEANNKEPQAVYYPKTRKSDGPYTLRIHSELSQKTWEFEVNDLATLNDYYKFYLDYSNVDNGEFDYQIISNEEVMDTGLIRIGIGQASVRGYDTPNEIIQYDMYGAPTERYQHKSISATSNGTYNVLPDEDYVALSEVDVYVNVPSDSGASYESGYTEGYASGYTQGSEDGYGSGYTKGTADGYGSGYTSGKTDGAAEQKAKLVATSFTENRTYTRVDGWNSVSVNVPQTGHTDEEMQQAYASGQTYQKSLLVATAVTSNGTYSRPNGYSSFVVNVAQTGHTDQELLDAFNSGYTNGKTEGYTSGWTNGYNSGKTDGYESGWTGGYDSGWTDGYISGYTDGSGQTPSTAATALTISVPSSITGSGKANVTAEPSTAILDLVYTSSDPTIATVDSNGNITVLTAGTVNICATDSISGLYDCDTVTVEPYSGLNIPFTVDVISGGSILWVANASATPLSIEYQINNGEWTSITATTAGTYINVVAGDAVKFRGDNSRYNTRQNGTPAIEYTNHFLMQTGKYAIRGNIMSLIDSTNYASITTFGNDSDGAFFGFFAYSLGLVDASGLLFPTSNMAYMGCLHMFMNCVNLQTSPEELPATSLSSSCYYEMFSGCTSLTTAPELPTTTLAVACYAGMFRGCTSLTTSPALPATTLASSCYKQMFYGCTSLTSAPALPATTLASRCYNGMFEGCTSLATAPVLPATTLADYCYTEMFYDCTSLTGAPNLPATTLTQSCYKSMFAGCTSLTTAPSLPATTLADYCYEQMFGDCTSLTTAPSLSATVLGKGCYASMFKGCTNITTAPALPATVLTEGCYAYMFQMCSSLIQAPTLQAPILAKQSYQGMFVGCTSLNQITCLAIDKTAQYCTIEWVSAVASTGTFIKDPNISESTWTRGNSGIPNNWTVQDAQ